MMALYFVSFVIVTFCFTCSYSLFLNRLQLRAIRIKMRSLTTKAFMMSPISERLSNSKPKDNDDNDVLHIEPSKNAASLQPINDSNFQEIINPSNDNQGLKVVLFTANWAGPGRAMAKNLVQTSMIQQNNLNTKKTLSPSSSSSLSIPPVQFYSIDTDYNPESSYMYNVRSIPCVLIFKDSNVVAEIVGTVPAQVIVDQLTKHSKDSNDSESESLWDDNSNNNDASYQ